MATLWLAPVFALLAHAEQQKSVAPAPGLIEVRGACELTAETDVPSQTVLVPLPLDYREQVPLSYELSSDPPSAIQSIIVRPDKLDNHVAEIVLAPMKANQKVGLAWKSWVLVAPRSFDDVPKTVKRPKEWPDEAKPWLASSSFVEAGDPRILEVAAEIRGDSDDVLEIVRSTLDRARTIYSKQEGRCKELGAVEALDKQGSCTSKANLVTALLRANGIPARILAGYPNGSGALQTHFIVEAYVPDYGWYPLESTALWAPSAPFRQVQVAIVPVEYENAGKRRFGGGAGVPYLSLTEFPGQLGGMKSLGTIEPDKNCDHVAEQRVRFAPEAEEWDGALSRARAPWRKWLGSNAARADKQRALRTPNARQLEQVSSIKELSRLLAR